MEILERCAREDVTFREQFYLDTLKQSYYILKLTCSSLGFKHSYSTIVQMKEIDYNNHPFLGRGHSEESKLKCLFQIAYVHLLNC